MCIEKDSIFKSWSHKKNKQDGNVCFMILKRNQPFLPSPDPARRHPVVVSATTLKYKVEIAHTSFNFIFLTLI